MTNTKPLLVATITCILTLVRCDLTLAQTGTFNTATGNQVRLNNSTGTSNTANGDEFQMQHAQVEDQDKVLQSLAGRLEPGEPKPSALK